MTDNEIIPLKQNNQQLNEKFSQLNEKFNQLNFNFAQLSEKYTQLARDTKKYIESNRDQVDDKIIALGDAITNDVIVRVKDEVGSDLPEMIKQIIEEIFEGAIP